MGHEGSFELGDKPFSPGDLASTSLSLDWDFPIDTLWRPPSPPPLPSHHTNLDPPQSSVPAELRPPSDGYLIPRSTLIDPLSFLAPPSPSHHMNIDLPQSSVVAEFQPPSGGDLASTPVRFVPPPLPDRTDRPRSAVEEELQAWRLPDLPSTPTGVELVENHLRPAFQCLPERHIDQNVFRKRPAVVNAGLPATNPSELPGVERGDGRMEVHYLTDNLRLCFDRTPCLENGERKIRRILETPDGYWTQRDWVAATNQGRIIGFKKTMDFHAKSGTKTKWIMNVYSLLKEHSIFVEDDLVLCHVFQQDSPGYDPRPKCPTFHQGKCDGSSAMHHGPDWCSAPRVNSYTPNPGFLVGDPDPDTSTERGVPPTADHAESKKRKVGSSDVWDYFTKIFARDIDGKLLTFAVCNHCSKVLTAGSKGGTTHLARHACPCKFKPVEAGRNYNAGIGVS